MKSTTKVTTITAKGAKIRQSVQDKYNWCKNARRKLLENNTETEDLVFNVLTKARRINAYRQQLFELGGHIYFADIYIARYHIIIEIDGGYHQTPERRSIDRERDRLCELAGIRVYRITNEEASDPETLMEFADIINTSPLYFGGHSPELERKHYKYLTTPNFRQYVRNNPHLRVLSLKNGKYKYRALRTKTMKKKR